ncbi:hypothetical protein MKW98_026576, partial [Papaver atlanticum]
MLEVLRARDELMAGGVCVGQVRSSEIVAVQYNGIVIQLGDKDVCETSSGYRGVVVSLAHWVFDVYTSLI